jgi:hypothetical protein
VLAGCGGAATSNGFEAKAPSGWEDATDTAELKSGGEFEAVWAGPADGGVTATLVVIRGAPVGRASLEGAVAKDRGLLEKVLGTAVRATVPQPMKLDGRPALAFDYVAGVKHARRVNAIHDGRLYAITLEASKGAFQRRRGTFDAYLASWRWK